jgi:flagella basal body P-ring formation protein FlgA
VLIAHPPGEIAISVRAGREVQQWVAARPLGPGAIVGPGDVRLDRRLVFGPPKRDDLSPLGWEVRRPLRPGDPVAPPAVQEPPVIRPGDPVRFEWRLGGMIVAREGLAANAARRGERVWARDAVRGERIEGIATGPGQARLGRGG